MRQIIVAVLLWIFLSSSLFGASISGVISDSLSGDPVVGASVYFPELRIGTVADLNGRYSISNLPSIRVSIQIIAIGYKSVVRNIDLSRNPDAILNIRLSEAVNEVHEVVVTGSLQSVEKNKSPYSIQLINKEELTSSSSTNIIDALSHIPGISQISTGSGISKPVIRGLGYNRVVVLQDGIRKEGQQWGDEHGIEIDEFNIDKVEIIKGPASLIYGSDALAGVISFESMPVFEDGVIKSSLSSEYQTNNGLYALSIRNAGRIKSVNWDMSVSSKNAHAYKNKKDGFVLNSGFSQKSINAALGINKHWGYSSLKMSIVNFIPGIIEGERDSASGRFITPVYENQILSDSILNDNALKSYQSWVPYQIVNDARLIWSGNVILQKGAIKWISGWQQNNRKEYTDPVAPQMVGLYLRLNTFNYNAKYEIENKKHWLWTGGASGMLQFSENKGIEFLIPDYTLFENGLYLSAHKNYDHFSIETGIRLDNRNIRSENLFLDSTGKIASGNTPGAVLKFREFNTSIRGVSAAFGVVYNPGRHNNYKLNFAKGFRAPNIAELTANGIHEGTFRYEIGNPNLKPEQNLGVDASYNYYSDHVISEFSLFSNTVYNFIFLNRLTNFSGNDSVIESVPVFQYQQHNALLYGAEYSLDIHPHPLDWLHWLSTFDFVIARQLHRPDSEKYIPFTPPARITSEFKATAKKIFTNLENSWISFGGEYYFAQNKIYAVNHTETATPAYLLLHSALGTDIKIKGQSLTLVFSVNNLLNTTYQSHLSRLKYAGYNYSQDYEGVYNMGRNFTIKLLINFETKRKKPAAK
jgi:iron complex outermembrane receptor protein